MSEERIAIIDGCLYNEKTGEVCMKARFIQKLVRCKDCKYSYHTLVGDSESDYRVALACSEIDDREVDPDWFCADGEREDDA